MKFCNNTNLTLPKQSQRSRSVLQDGSRSLGLFWKEKTPSYNRRNTVISVKTRRRGGTSVDEPDKDGEPDKADAQGSETGEPAAMKRKEENDVKVETHSPKPAPPTRPHGKIIIHLTLKGPITTAADDKS